jgi:hypothetical protein
MFLPSAVFGSAVTFSTTLPVAQDQIVVRFYAQPSFSTRSLASFQFPVSVGYGYSSKLALFASLSQGLASQNGVTNGGPGDLGLYGRYTLYKHDTPNSTFRITPVAGAYLPTGDNRFVSGGRLQGKSLQLGSGTVNPYVGAAAGFNGKRYALAGDATYRHNSVTSKGFNAGSELRLDMQFEAKIWPIHAPEEGLPHLVNLSFESNYYQDARDHLDGVESANSGGRTLREAVTLQLSSLRWQAGGGVQMPVVQDLNGVNRSRLKIGYIAFFEYYLAAPSWRKRR